LQSLESYRRHHHRETSLLLPSGLNQATVNGRNQISCNNITNYPVLWILKCYRNITHYINAVLNRTLRRKWTG